MNLSERLCLQFCPYYKSSKDETLACRGFAEVQSLIEKGVQISFHVRGRAVGAETIEALRQRMCVVCLFYKEDCDFILKGRDASPCGGFLLLEQLIEEGTISVDDIGDAD